MHTAAALLYPQALASSLTLPMEILGAAAQLAQRQQRGPRPLRFLLAGQTDSTVVLSSGLRLQPDCLLAELPPLDLLLLPAIWRSPRATLRTLEHWWPSLRTIAAQGTRICSVGTASHLLAEAGLLDGRAATTHWHDFEHFARRYPAVELKTRHLITQSDNLYCVGSVNSIADFSVHMAELWFGSAVARAVEHQFSPEIRRPFRAAAWQDTQYTAHHDETVLQVQQWLQDALHQPLQLETLAQRLGISSRTLNRRFHQATGLSPQRYLSNLRLQTARELLRRSNLNIGEIAWRVGYQDAGYFAGWFRRGVGMTPGEYRAAVRGKLFQPPGATPLS